VQIFKIVPARSHTYFSFAAGAFDAKHTQFGEIEKSQARSRLQNVSREEPALLTNDLRFEDLELNSD
jgi:hypothetical protein